MKEKELEAQFRLAQKRYRRSSIIDGREILPVGTGF
jgi:hypothetical protein